MCKKSGFVSLIGEPNSGKSTLINTLLGEELSIVSSKPQTTRNRIYGILTKENYQIVFTDTPGLFKPRYKMQSLMRREIDKVIPESDLIMIVADLSSDPVSSIDKIINEHNILNDNLNIPIFCVLTKSDISTNEFIAKSIAVLSTKYNFKEIIPVSSVTGFNIPELLNLIVKYLPEGEFYYDKDIFSPHPERFFVSEIIRGNILRLLSDEVPFSVFVDIEEYKEKVNKKDYIRVSVITEKESQKPILIGKGGSMIKKISSNSRIEIEKFLGREVFLELKVKVRKNWRNDETFLKRNFGKLSAYLI